MYKIGQTLYFANSDRRLSHREVTITKAGRKWLTMDNGYRVDIDTMRIDGGVDRPSLGRCYLSKADYEAEVALAAAWKEFRQAVHDQYVIPPGVTLDRIEQAKALLFGEALSLPVEGIVAQQAAEIERLRRLLDDNRRISAGVQMYDSELFAEKDAEIERLQAEVASSAN